MAKWEVYHVSFNKKSDDYRLEIIEAESRDHCYDIVKKKYRNAIMVSGWPKNVEEK